MSFQISDGQGAPLYTFRVPCKSIREDDRLYLYIEKRLNTDRLSVQYVTLPVWNPDYTLMTDTRCATACFDAAGIALRVQDLTPVAYPCKQLYKSMPCREIHPACPSKRTDGCTVSISAGSMVKLPICFPKADTTLT